MEINTIHNGDCLELMHQIDDKSIDMILCDLPYGTTACKWDKVIPFEPLWAHYKRIIKDNGAIVLNASQPFTSALVMSNIKMFKYCWLWQKERPSNFFQAKFAPLNQIEDICVFSLGGCNNGAKIPMTYRPQGVTLIDVERGNSNTGGGVGVGKGCQSLNGKKYRAKQQGYPKTLLTYATEHRGLHPTQKPVALFEYLIKTYTNEGELVLDNCSGSGTTGIACKNTNRNFILMEKDDAYFNIAKTRIGL